MALSVFVLADGIVYHTYSCSTEVPTR